MENNLLEPELPDVPQLPQDTDVTDRFGYDVGFNVGFLGAGQGGGRLAAAFYEIGYSRVAAVNTDIGDLSALPPEIQKLDLETGGAGKDPEKGAAAISGKEEQVRELMTRAIGKKADYLLICAGLGGGTGSGLAPKLIEIARKYMRDNGRSEARVGAALTLPHPAEGQTPARNAVRAFRDILRMNVSPMLIIDNKRIGDLFRTGVTNFYKVANAQTVKLFHVFNQLSAQKSPFVSFDRADFASLLDSGLCVFGASPIEKFASEADISSAIREQLERTVLAPVNFKQGKMAGCIFVGSNEILGSIPMDIIDGGFASLSRMLADGSTLHRGIYEGSTTGLRCYTILSQLPPPSESLRRLAEEARISDEGGMADFLQV
jgi:cell division GTPase FtsZ